MKTKHAMCAYTNLNQTLVNTILGNVCRIGGRTMVIEITSDKDVVSQYYIPAASIEQFIMEINGKVYLKEGVHDYLSIFHISNWKPCDLIELSGVGATQFIFSQSVDLPRADDNVITRVMKTFLRTLPPMSLSSTMANRVKGYISDLNNGTVTEDKSLQRSHTLMRILGYDIGDMTIVQSNKAYKVPEETFGEKLGSIIDTGAQVVNTVLGKL